MMPQDYYAELGKIHWRLAEHIQNSGFWFTSCPKYVEYAEQAVQAGLLVSVEDILKDDPRIDNEPAYDGAAPLWTRGKAFYVPYTIRSAAGLPHNVYLHIVECVPC